MSGGEGPRLLARERAELESVAAPLREGRRVVAFLVCEPDLRPAVLGYLRDASGVAVPEPARVSEPGQMVDALVKAADRLAGEVCSLLVEKNATEVLKALNWNREKLRRGASVLVWVDGIEGLRALRAVAPDAYSFRDMMVVVSGEEPVEGVPPAEEPIELQLVRIPYEAASTPRARAEAAISYASALRDFGRSEEVLHVVDEAVTALSEDAYSDSLSGQIRGHLRAVGATSLHEQGRFARAWRAAKSGAAEAENLPWSLAHSVRLTALIRKRTPIGVDRGDIDRVFSEMLPRDDEHVQANILVIASERAALRGDLVVAEELLGRVRGHFNISKASIALVARSQGQLCRLQGHLATSEVWLRRAIDLSVEAGIGTAGAMLALSRCLSDKGEHESSRRLLQRVTALVRGKDSHEHLAGLRRTELAIEEGAIDQGLLELRALIAEAAMSGRDGHVYDTCTVYARLVRGAYEAGRLSFADLIDADAELEVAQDISISLCPNDDPPWYTILYPGLRADVLSLRPDRLPDAIALTSTAVERARAVWPDAAPMHARMLIGHLVTAGRLDEARAALAVAEPEAEGQRHLRELARLRALAVTVLVRTSAPRADIDAKLAALRGTLDETGAPRIAAEALLELSLLLPPETKHPEPLDLLDEAHALFVEMPIPAQEARCLEAMGDILSARGDLEEARRRYLAAKGTYERYDLGLRLPQLTKKLDALTPAPRSPPLP